MSIRLNKALRELNIGLQTAVEFLEKEKTWEMSRQNRASNSPTSNTRH